MKGIIKEIKDLGLQEYVKEALPYAVVGGAWEGSLDNPIDADAFQVVLSHIVPSGQQLKILYLRTCTQADGGARFSIVQTNPSAAGATGTVEGQVVDSLGLPAAGLRVRLYDADSLAGDDHLADGHTDNSGQYQLRYAAGSWDCCRGFRESNPDIYAEVWRKSAQAPGGWSLVDRSRVFRNHLPSAALPIDFKLRQ